MCAKSLTYYAIDSEETHQHYFDPDDAFTVEKHADGTATVHVAIVDSTSIARGSPEYKRAAKMAESKYAPVYNPMLSMDTNKKIGLKDGENHALVTSVHLSASGEVLDTSFAFKDIHVQLMTHKQASDALMEGKSEDLQALSQIANQLYSSRETRTQRTEYDESTGMRLSAEGLISYQPAASYNVHKMIGEMMKLSNHATAMWADTAHLPFVFRNCVGAEDIHFDISALSRFEKNTPEREETRDKIIKVINTPATFSAINKGHGHMKIDAYAFTTSPLRRYADIVNQKQLAYAITVEQTLEYALAPEGGASEDLTRLLWKELEHTLMPVLVAAHVPSASGVHTHKVQAIVREIAKKAQGEGIAVREPVGEHLANSLLAISPSYMPIEIAQIGEGLNYTLKASDESKRRSSIDRMDRWLKKVMAHPDPDILRDASRDDFTNLLERAAITGQMNQALHDETIARLEAGDRLKPYKAYAGILFLAPNDEGEAGLWKNLKRRVLEDLRFNNKAMTQLSEMLANSSQKIKLNIGVPIYSDIQLEDAQGHAAIGAHYVIKINDEFLSPPDFTIMPDGHQAIAKSEALFNLVHSLAYGNLVPVDEVKMPDALNTSIQRIALPMDLLRTIAKEHHLALSTRVSPSRRRGNDGYTARVTLALPDGETIVEHRFAANNNDENADITSTEDALRRAAQRVLRHPTMKHYLPADTYVDYRAPEDPLKALQDIAVTNQLQVHFSQPESIMENHQLLYRVGLNITQLRHGKSDASPPCVYFQGHVNADSEARASYVLAKQALETLRACNLLQETPPAITIEPANLVQHMRETPARNV